MANKADFLRLMSGFLFVREGELAEYNARIVAEWQRLNAKQRADLVRADYRTRIWLAGFEAGQADVRNGEQVLIYVQAYAEGRAEAGVPALAGEKR